MTLDEAVAQLVNVGEKDPIVIARKIAKKYDSKWLGTELLALSEDLISEMARRKLNSVRRSAELSLRAGDSRANSDLMTVKAWIPGEGWKRASDLTSEDCRKRASFYDLLSSAAVRRATWFREVANLMDIEGVETLGQLEHELPVLPEGGAVELIA